MPIRYGQCGGRKMRAVQPEYAPKEPEPKPEFVQGPPRRYIIDGVEYPDKATAACALGISAKTLAAMTKLNVEVTVKGRKVTERGSGRAPRRWQLGGEVYRTKSEMMGRNMLNARDLADLISRGVAKPLD